MPTGLTNRVIDHLRRAALPRDGAGLGDGELLGCFVERRDETAIAALVTRHGPMVWGVCRRLLSYHDAEDAFQATFLVLVRKAATIAPREMVGNWLYGVAHQTALQARRAAARRRTREVQVTALPDTGAAQQDLWADVQPLLDEELSRLPDIYRAVIVLCDLEGRTRKEVAGHLGCPEGTVGGRLARARAMLAKRLARRGVVLSSAALAAVLVQNAASACAPTLVASNTISAASSFAVVPAATGSVSVKVAALTEGVLKAMLTSKLKAVATVALLLGFIAAGATALTGRWASAREHQPPATEPKVNAPPRPEPELNRPGAALPDLAGTWQGDDWGTVVLRPAKDGGFEGTYSDTFGKDVGRIAVRWSPASRRYEGTWSEGTYRFGRIALDAPKGGAISGAYATDPKCEHQPGVPSLASLKWNKKPAKNEKEAAIAWGKEVDGLQAGLALVPAVSHGYRPGETVNLEVRLRNVGKTDVTVTYGLLQESAPRITDAKGAQVFVTMPPILGIIVIPTERALKPGQTITLYNPTVALETVNPEPRTGPKPFVMTPTIRVEPGKYKIAFGGMVHSHPTLSTGTTEFEVREPTKPVAAKEEAFTAWGKEINGLQAGLGFPAGQKRVYTHGETVALIVRVRNVGKEDVKFQYLRQFFAENPPAVTGADGKPVPLDGLTTRLGIHGPVDVSLAPGKEIELYEKKLELKPGNKVGSHTLRATGKLGLQYEQVFGNSTSGRIRIDPDLCKLATGKLALEVKEEK